MTAPPPLDPTARRPVWEALSTLFLDTDVDSLRECRAAALAASPYALAELDAILIDEVYPVCRANLRGVAGEWAGFDPAWLEARILRRRRSRWRAFHRLALARVLVPRWGEWLRTRDAVAARRAGAAGGPADDAGA